MYPLSTDVVITTTQDNLLVTGTSLFWHRHPGMPNPTRLLGVRVQEGGGVAKSGNHSSIKVGRFSLIPSFRCFDLFREVAKITSGIT
jgi:hypothetical protein